MVKVKKFAEWDSVRNVNKKWWYSIVRVVGGLILLFGFAFAIFSSTYEDFSTVKKLHESNINPASSKSEAERDHDENAKFQMRKAGRCDIFIGDWVYDPSLEPSYNNKTCWYIQEHQNCIKNGRPDTGYLYWRWKPRNCDIPRFDGKKFLEIMRDKSLAFIGDSISRNHVQSLLCMLFQVETNIVQVYHDEEFQSETWHFPLYNFTLAVIWSPLLIKANMNEGFNDDIHMHLDVLDEKWTREFDKYDFTVISGGQWFLRNTIFIEQDQVVGCHNCRGKFPQLGFEYSYRMVLRLVLNYITTSKRRGITILRTIAPSHFEDDKWCKRTVPFKQGETRMSDGIRILRFVELEEYARASKTNKKVTRKLALLDITKLSLLRPDAHPGSYTHMRPFAGEDMEAEVQNDCLHWCLPGHVEYWNELMMQLFQENLDEES